MVERLHHDHAIRGEPAPGRVLRRRGPHLFEPRYGVRLQRVDAGPRVWEEADEVDVELVLRAEVTDG